MRRAAKVDETQPEVIEAFEANGFTVQRLDGVGKGCPDLAVALWGYTAFVEVVGPAKIKKYPPRGVMPNQQEWHDAWGGDVHVIRNRDDAMAVSHYIRNTVQKSVPIVGQIVGDRVIK